MRGDYLALPYFILMHKGNRFYHTWIIKWTGIGFLSECIAYVKEYVEEDDEDNYQYLGFHEVQG